MRARGTDSAISFDARVVSIARDDLEAQVASGSFRQDLYYRLNVLQLDLPPLRARGADVLLLASHFLAQAARRRGRPVAHIAPEAARKLLTYGWPGNARELANVLERASALTDHGEIHPSHLPDDIRCAHLDDAQHSVASEHDLLTLEEVSRRHILRSNDASGCRRRRLIGARSQGRIALGTPSSGPGREVGASAARGAVNEPRLQQAGNRSARQHGCSRRYCGNCSINSQASLFGMNMLVKSSFGTNFRSVAW